MKMINVPPSRKYISNEKKNYFFNFNVMNVTSAISEKQQTTIQQLKEYNYT